MKDDQRILITKRILREGMFRLLERKPLQKITVTELCAEAGINRATFYRHYEQPADILNELRRQVFAESKMLAVRDQAGANPRQWLEHLCRYFYDNAQLLKILIETRSDQEFIELINRACHSNFSQLQQTYVGESADEADLNLMAHYYAGGMYSIIRRWITGPMDKTPEEMAALIYRLLMHR